MALVLGVNCGFVTVAPTTDPQGTNTNQQGNAVAIPDTTPSGVSKITEIGFWIGSQIGSNDYDIGIYDDTGSGYPGNLISTISTGTITSTGWHVQSGLDISISANTTYWIAVQISTGGTAGVDFATLGGTGRSAYVTSQLDDPWNSTNTGSSYRAFYAVVEAGEPSGTNMQINIGDVWKEVPAVQINIGDAWKEVVGIQKNIGDVWKEVF